MSDLAHLNSNLYGTLITFGRNTNKPHKVTVGFYLDNDHIYLLSHIEDNGEGTDWYKNLTVNPSCKFVTNRTELECTASASGKDDELEEKIRTLFKEKQGSGTYNSWYKGTSRIPVLLKIDKKKPDQSEFD